MSLGLMRVVAEADQTVPRSYARNVLFMALFVLAIILALIWWLRR